MQMNIPKLNELTEYQWEIMNLPLHGRYLISGSPGSGKSSIALLRANAIVRESPITCLGLMFYSRVQRDYSADGIAQYGLDAYKNIWTRWQISYLRQQGVTWDNNTPIPWRKLSEIILERGVEAQFDHVIVDDVQNYLEADLQVLSLLAKDATFFVSIPALLLSLSKLDASTINSRLCDLLKINPENQLVLNRVFLW